MSKALQRFAMARYNALTWNPYLASVIYQFMPYEDDGVETMVVTKKWNCVFNPSWLLQRTLDELGSALVHAAMHAIQEHDTRGVGLMPDIWNLATCCTINSQMAYEPYVLLDDAVQPKKVGLPVTGTAEQYYDKLAKSGRQTKSGGKGKGQSDQFESGACGGVAGNPHDIEAKYDKTVGRTPYEQSQARTDVAQAVHQAQQADQATLGLEVWADAFLGPPVVPWQAVLRRLAGQGVASFSGQQSDYVRDRPSRRQMGMMKVGDVTNHRIVSRVPYISLVFDTSGSMQGAPVVAALREIKGIIERTGAEVLYLSADAVVCDAGIISTFKQIKCKTKGGGGTDFRPAFEYIRKLSRRPQVLIYLTDCCGSAPEQDPRLCKTIWCGIGNDDIRPPAPWGSFVKIPVSSR